MILWKWKSKNKQQNDFVPLKRFGPDLWLLSLLIHMILLETFLKMINRLEKETTLKYRSIWALDIFDWDSGAPNE